VFANSTANTFFRVNMRPLQANLYFGNILRFELDTVIFSASQRTFAVRNYFESVAANQEVIITCRVFVRWHFCIFDFYHVFGDALYFNITTTNRLKDISGIDGLGADGAVFLAYDTWPVHGPWQAAISIDKGGTEFDRALFSEFADTQFFFECDWPDCCGRADLAAGDAVELTSARADSIVQNRSPEAFDTVLYPGRLNDIRGAYPHTLTALDASLEKLFFRQRAGRSNRFVMPVVCEFPAKANRRQGKRAGGQR
jgi:hypothetical protein